MAEETANVYSVVVTIQKSFSVVARTAEEAERVAQEVEFDYDSDEMNAEALLLPGTTCPVPDYLKSVCKYCGEDLDEDYECPNADCEGN